MRMTNDGRALEAAIGEFFEANGYATERNVVLEGRSGGRHEVDVLAVKADGVTEFRVVVECKQWNRPIEKDVVSKVGYVVQDLGLNKGIVVSLEGWRVGAERAASELRIDLWDSVDLEKRLGGIAVSHLKGGSSSPQRRVTAPRPVVDRDFAVWSFERRRSGIFGSGERVAWIELAYAPMLLVRIRLSHDHTSFGRTHLRTKSLANLYDTISGSFHSHLNDGEIMEVVPATRIIPARLRDRKIVSSLMKECGRLTELVSAPALERQKQVVESLGIPAPYGQISVESTEEVAWPYYIALLKEAQGLFRGGGKERLVAVDAAGKTAAVEMSDVFTLNFTYVCEALSGSRNAMPPEGKVGS
jgi:Restriction endonuclease